MTDYDDKQSIPIDEYYVYMHYKADNMELFYIGSGKGPRAFNMIGRNEVWKRIAKKHKVLVKITHQGFKSKEEAVEKELELQIKYKPEACIVYGHRKKAIVPQSTRDKMSKRRKGVKFSKEHRDKISKSKMGDKNPMKFNTGDKNHFYGKTHTKESRERMSKSTKEYFLNNKHHNAKRVINCRGEVFESLSEASRQFKLASSGSITSGIQKGHSAGKYKDGTPVKWEYYIEEEDE